jgi:hypothetical protein
MGVFSSADRPGARRPGVQVDPAGQLTHLGAVADLAIGLHAGVQACSGRAKLASRTWAGPLEERSAAGSSRTPLRLACRTRTIWQCWPVPSLSGLLSTSPSSQGPGCPQLQPACCDGPAVVSFHHRTVRNHLVALEVGDPQLVRPGCREVPLHQVGGSGGGRIRGGSPAGLATADGPAGPAHPAAAQRCSEPPRCPHGAAAARPCGRGRRRSARPAHGRSRP